MNVFTTGGGAKQATADKARFLSGLVDGGLLVASDVNRRSERKPKRARASAGLFRRSGSWKRKYSPSRLRRGRGPGADLPGRRRLLPAHSQARRFSCQRRVAASWPFVCGITAVLNSIANSGAARCPWSCGFPTDKAMRKRADGAWSTSVVGDHHGGSRAAAKKPARRSG